MGNGKCLGAFREKALFKASALMAVILLNSTGSQRHETAEDSPLTSFSPREGNDISYAQHGYIYWIKNTVKNVKL